MRGQLRFLIYLAAPSCIPCRNHAGLTMVMAEQNWKAYGFSLQAKAIVPVLEQSRVRTLVFSSRSPLACMEHSWKKPSARSSLVGAIVPDLQGQRGALEGAREYPGAIFCIANAGNSPMITEPRSSLEDLQRTLSSLKIHRHTRTRHDFELGPRRWLELFSRAA